MTKEVINPVDMWDTRGRSYSHVVKVTNPNSLIFIAGQAAVDKDLNFLATDIEGQTRAIFENLKKELAAAGATLDDIVDMTVYLGDIDAHKWAVRNVRAEYFESGSEPVSTMVEISKFGLEGMLIEIDAIAATS
jgi:2-iminobutanoate/2-iminopropanoate deaminase